MNVGCKRPQHQSRKSSDHKDEDECHRPEEWGLHVDGTFVQGGCPVEHLDGGGDGDKEGDEGENPACRVAHS